MKSQRRPYQQVARAEAALETARAIKRAAFGLWRERDLDEITLEDVAGRAGVSVQTVIRRFGSKQGLLDACMEDPADPVENDVRALRDQALPGDVPGAIRNLLAHYERDGDAVLRMLAVEGRSASADRIIAHGRAEHRRWCARVFAPFLPGVRAAGYGARLDAFVAATDIYLWKLWRRDLGRSEPRTAAAWEVLLSALASGGRELGGRER